MAHTNLIEKLQEKNALTIEDEMVCVKPLNQYDFTTYPIVKDDCIKVTIEEYLGLITYVYMFDETLTSVVDYVNPVVDFEVLGGEQTEEPIEEEEINEEEQNTEEIINE